MITRAQVIACAKSFVGTPFAHQGRRKGYEADCVGLVMMVGKELGVMDVLDQYTDYGPEPHGDLVYQCCVKHLVPRPLSQYKPGMVLSIRCMLQPCHVAIAAELFGQPSMIHAYNVADKVTENSIDMKWRARLFAAFDYPGVIG